MSQTSSANNPKHIAIIMDGNGRWAKARNRPRTLGHRAGAAAVRNVVEFCIAHSISVLTLFAFSSENWQRPSDEVSALMRLFLKMLESEVDELARQGVQLRFIGERSKFSTEIQAKMLRAENLNLTAKKMTLVLAASYGGRWDIVQAAKKLAAEVAAGKCDIDSIDENSFSAALSVADLPAPDLFIRTGGEQRISNFLLWQLAYTELWFTETLWPDVDATIMQQALDFFTGRERRFGLISEQLAGDSR